MVFPFSSAKSEPHAHPKLHSRLSMPFDRFDTHQPSAGGGRQEREEPMKEESLTDVRGNLMETLSTFDQEPSIEMMSWNGSLFDGIGIRRETRNTKSLENRKTENCSLNL